MIHYYLINKTQITQILQNTHNMQNNGLKQKPISFSKYSRGGTWQQEIQQYLNYLQKISLWRCDIDDSNIDYFNSLSIPKLKQLDLYDNNITAEGVQILLEEDWPKLQLIGLNSNPIKDEGMCKILEKLKNKVKRLFLSRCNITDLALCMMISSPPTNLIELTLDHNKLGNQGAKYLVKINLPMLQKISINQCNIQNEGGKHLMKGKWPLLRHLSMNNVYYFNMDVCFILSMETDWNKLYGVQIFQPSQIISIMSLAQKKLSINYTMYVNRKLFGTQFRQTIATLIKNSVYSRI